MTKPVNRPSLLADRACQLGLLFVRSEQRMLAVMILVSLCGIGLWGWRYAARVNQLIDIDRRTPQVATFQIDLNEATWQEISSLPGIGDLRAKEIVTYRDQIVSFPNNEAIQEVVGIGPKTYQRIAPFLIPISSESPVSSPPRTASAH